MAQQPFHAKHGLIIDEAVAQLPTSFTPSNNNDITPKSYVDGKMANPMTTAGDLIIGGTNGAPSRLAKGTDGQVLSLVSGLPSWATPSGGAPTSYICTAGFSTQSTTFVNVSSLVSSTTVANKRYLVFVSGLLKVDNATATATCQLIAPTGSVIYGGGMGETTSNSAFAELQARGYFNYITLSSGNYTAGRFFFGTFLVKTSSTTGIIGVQTKIDNATYTATLADGSMMTIQEVQ